MFFDKDKVKPGASLMDALNFDETDLDYNRQGEFSPAQQQRLFQRQQLTLTYSIILSGVLLFAILLIPTARQAIIFLFAGMGVAGYFLFTNGSEWVSLSRDLKQGKVKQVEGRIRLDVEGQGKNGVAYSVRIDQEYWKINKDTFLAFKNEDPYIIYFASHSRKILSAEWLR